jgi:hypothetical protein
MAYNFSLYKRGGGQLIIPQVPIDLSATKALLDQYYFTQDGKPNADGSGTLANGSFVRSILGKTGGIGGNRMLYANESEPAITQQIATRPDGGVPKYISQDGGYLHIPNGRNIQYRFVDSIAGTPAIAELWYICRLHSGKRYEAIMSGDRGPELKRFNTGEMQFNLNDYVTSVSTFSYEPVEYETIVFHFIYNTTAGNVNIRVTDSIGDYRNLATITIPTNTTFSNFGVGTPSHPASHDYFGYLMKYGSALSVGDRATILANLKQVFPIGALPNKSFSKPIMNFSGSTFTISPNYQLRGGATSIDSANTIVRWYMLKNNVSGGNYPNNPLANSSLLATTTGNQLSLNMNSYPQFVQGGTGVGDEIIGAVSVYDNLGQAFPIECATDPRRTI